MTMGVPDFCKLECMICSDIHVVTMNVYVKVSCWATHYACLGSSIYTNKFMNAKHVCLPLELEASSFIPNKA
jgi:predicted transglutaminase-like protease